METLNIYFDCEFTSLSPDAQLISIGMVTDEVVHKDVCSLCGALFDHKTNTCTSCNGIMFKGVFKPKSFYAEFIDYDINRCDTWVKENVVRKLKYSGTTTEDNCPIDTGNYFIYHSTDLIKARLKEWISQFRYYHIQFVVDCGTWDWYHLLQLLAVWHQTRTNETYVRESDGKVCDRLRMIGLPKLPANISPVPFDLNDLIAIKKGITPAEAFDLNREELAIKTLTEMDEIFGFSARHNAYPPKHHALWDATMIKSIYNKLA